MGTDNRTDLIGPATTSRSTVHRHQPIVRAAQMRCDADQTIFKIHKGVKTFDLCTAKNVLVTGGMDRVIRLWNPYLPARPVARLRGHNAPVFLVKIAVEDNRLFSISADKTVLVSFIYFFFKINNNSLFSKKYSTKILSFFYRTSPFLMVHYIQVRILMVVV